MTTNPEPSNNQPAYGSQAPQHETGNQAPQYNANAYGQSPYGIDPQAAEAAKKSKTMGIWAIVCSAVGLIIFGVLGLVGLSLGINGLKLSKQAETGGIAQVPGKTLSIIGIVLGSITTALWVLSLMIRFAS